MSKTNWRYKLFNRVMSENGRTVHLLLSLDGQAKLYQDGLRFGDVSLNGVACSCTVRRHTASMYPDDNRVALNIWDVIVLSAMFNSIKSKLERTKRKEALHSASWLREIVTKASVSLKE